jgi:hypothetical protein
MGRTGLILIGAACVAAASCALAGELPPSGSEPAGQGKSKILKPTKPNSAGPTKIPFSNPYAPPVGAGKSAGAEFPAARRQAPVDPKGHMSFTYKWKASNDPVDPYWNMRSAPGSEAPGNKFMGGLKLGF